MAKQNLLQTLLDGPLAISGTTVDVTNDIVWGEVINITNADAVLTNRKKTVFELVKVNIVNNVVSFVKRGLTKSETETEDVNLKKSWKKGDYLYITVLAPSFISIDNSQQRQSPQDFSGYTNTFGDTIHNGYAKFQGTTNPGVIFPELTEAQMNALTPIGPAIIKNTTDGEWYKWGGGAWTQISTGGTFPRATDVIEGKVRVQTDAEYLAGSDTGGDGATLVTKPSKIVEQINTEISSIEHVLTNSDFMTGEDLGEGDSIFGEEPIIFAEADQSQNVGDVAGNTRVGIRGIGSGTEGSQLELPVSIELSPSVDVSVRIEDDGVLVDEATVDRTTFTKSDDFTGTTVDTALWTDIVNGGSMVQDGTLLFDDFLGNYRGFSAFTHYYKTDNIAEDLEASLNIQNFRTNATVTKDGYLSLYKDSDNRVSVVFSWQTGGADLRERRLLKRVNGTTTTIANIPLVGNDCKIVKKGSKIEAYYFNVTWIKIGETLFLDEPLSILLTASVSDGGGSKFGGIIMDNFSYNKLSTIFEFTAPLSLTRGTAYDIVLYQGTYGSETVNATNYYKLGYDAKNTTTRGLKLFDGTSRGEIDEDKFTFVNSDLFEDLLLSKTDARYTYKLPDIPRIVDKAYSAGEIPKRDFKGISKHLTGLTKGTELFVSDTPGALSITAGTNSCILGKVINTDEVLLNRKVQSFPITLGSSPFTWTNETNNPVQIKITGGTVNPIVIDGVTVATATNHINTVPAGKSVVITYSSAPTVVYSDI